MRQTSGFISSKEAKVTKYTCISFFQQLSQGRILAFSTIQAKVTLISQSIVFFNNMTNVTLMSQSIGLFNNMGKGYINEPKY